MKKRWLVKVDPLPHLHAPFDLGPYRWHWMARLRVRHYLSNGMLRASTRKVEIVDMKDPWTPIQGWHVDPSRRRESK